MIRGLWSATGGMITRELKQDVIAHNLANAATSGFKRRCVAFRSVPQTFGTVLEQQLSSSTVPCAAVSVPYCEDYQDPRPGSFQQTENKLNLSIEGDGSFAVEDGGAMTMTRNGNFLLGPEGELMTSTGEKVLGERGPIQLPEGSLEVDPEGNVAVDGQVIDKIKIVPAGNGAGTSDVRIRQGELEMSNVSVVTEMVDMISNLRAYEANQKAVYSIDQTLDRLINEAAK